MEPYIGNIQMFGAFFAPRNYALCNGQILDINQNQTLYVLLGNTFGGTPQLNFQLPDLQGRMPVNPGTLKPSNTNLSQGQFGGLESVALLQSEMPAHNHVVNASSQVGDSPRPNNKKLTQPTVFAASAQNTSVYSLPANLVKMNGLAIGATGAGTAHNNMQPSTAVNFCIALTGIFPNRD